MLSPIDEGKRIHCAAKQRPEISKEHLQTVSELVVPVFEQDVGWMTLDFKLQWQCYT
jgi:hypothetical protein